MYIPIQYLQSKFKYFSTILLVCFCSSSMASPTNSSGPKPDITPAVEPNNIFADTDICLTVNEDQKSVCEAAESAVKRIRSIPGVDTELAKEAIAIIREIAKSTRALQDLIYSFVRTVNRNIQSVSDCTEYSNGCPAFKNKVMAQTESLLFNSYSDDLFQNENLARQIKTSRLPHLLEESLKLSGANAAYSRKAFIKELELVTNRVESAYRFRAGVGISYQYLPAVNYSGIARIDTSPFLPNATGGSDRLIFDDSFSDRSYGSVNISAKIPYLLIDAYFSSASKENTISTPVIFRGIDTNGNELLTRSTVNSELTVDYDVNLKLPLYELFTRSEASQVELGLGVGLTGFSMENNISTDVRFRSNNSSVFNELASESTITTRL